MCVCITVYAYVCVLGRGSFFMVGVQAESESLRQQLVEIKQQCAVFESGADKAQVSYLLLSLLCLSYKSPVSIGASVQSCVPRLCWSVESV